MLHWWPPIPSWSALSGGRKRGGAAGQLKRRSQISELPGFLGGMMNRFRPTPEQESLRPYLSQTYNLLPVRRGDLCKIKVPFCIGVSPFPDDLPAPPCAPYNFFTAPFCQKCKAEATSRFCHCPDDTGWLCGVCNFKNLYSDDRPRFHGALQVQVPVWEGFFFHPASRIDLSHIVPIQHQSLYHLLVFELSEFAQPIFAQAIDRLIEALKPGYFSVFVFNSGLIVPIIASNRRRFSVANAVDMADGPVLPPTRLLFFDVEKERDLFIRYVQFLKGLKPAMVTFSMLSLVKALNSLLVDERIPVSLVICQTPIDDEESIRQFSIDSAFHPFTHFEIFALDTPSFPPDYGPISNLSIFLNAIVRKYHVSQVHVLPDDIVQSLFKLKLVDVVITCFCSPMFKVADVLGPGSRRADKSFSVGSMAPNDTVYFYFDYNFPVMKVAQPAIQFQVRYFDAFGRTIVRVFTTTFPFADNMFTCTLNANFDVHVAAVAVLAAEQAREFGTVASVRAALEKSGSDFVDDTFVRLLLISVEKLQLAQIREALIHGHKLISRTEFSCIIGRCPADIIAFFAPVAYAFHLGATEMTGPFLVNGHPVLAGAYYVALPGRHGVVLLAPTEDVGAWAKAINEEPMTELLGTVCHEKRVEILAPATSAGHPLFVHLLKCMERQ
jgi:hypothetical protein